MRKLILSTGLCMTALTALVFVVYQVAAEPDAQGGAATEESSPISEQRAKVAAGANARWLREWIAEDEATHSVDNTSKGADKWLSLSTYHTTAYVHIEEG